MIGKRSQQRELFDVGNVFSYAPASGSFYAQLAAVSATLFSDDEFASMYAERKGRPSVPPSLMALTTVMQYHACVSDVEAVERTGCDLRWCAVLCRPAGDPLCSKSTLALFRAHLVLHGGIRGIFEKSLTEARKAGLLPKELIAAIDTKPILGQGAALDTYNLLATGVRQLAATLARATNAPQAKFMKREGLTRYQAPSIKGAELLDWSDPVQRDAFLSGIVADSVKLLRMASRVDNASVRDAASLLEQVLLQDVDVVDGPDGDTATIHRGVAHGRVPSATDPEQRHGRKSKSKTFTGAKAVVVTDTASGIIVETEIIAGDAPDATGALELVKRAEENVGVAVVDTLGDCAYGSGETRQAFTDAGRQLSVRVPLPEVRNGLYTKNAFRVDLDARTAICPNGVTTTTCRSAEGGGMVFLFGKACAGCPLRGRCTQCASGRTISVHPQEALLRETLARQKTPQWRTHMRRRLAVENSLARLARYGIGQARYIGHQKTRFQLKMSATLANLRCAWNDLARQQQAVALKAATG